MKVEITCHVTVQQHGRDISLWLPVPADTGYQTVTSLDYEGNYQEVRLLRATSQGAGTLYAHWQDDTRDGDIRLRMEVETRARRASLTPNVVDTGSDEVERFLEPTPHIPVDGIVKREAERITAGMPGLVGKAKAIYEWVICNTHRDSQAESCGIGDVKSILENGSLCGKCVDINSLFVALARAAGIPARELFGIRVGESGLAVALGKSGDITKSQHCKSEVYLGSAGWVPADPADVVKVMDEKLPARTIDAVRSYLFGNSEDNWVAFNHARDFMLNPPQRARLLNYFMYPYCEVDGKRMALEPGKGSYTIFSRVHYGQTASP